jgi:hypothetical protein
LLYKEDLFVQNGMFPVGKNADKDQASKEKLSINAIKMY